MEHPQIDPRAQARIHFRDWKDKHCRSGATISAAALSKNNKYLLMMYNEAAAVVRIDHNFYASMGFIHGILLKRGLCLPTALSEPSPTDLE